MQIREIHIDGFGNFFDKTISGFGPGLNIIYGENESGKTTILEFIRRTLFGLNPKKSGGLKNNYLPQRGGVHGGKISCLTSDGKPFVIVRAAKPGAKDGQVTVRVDAKEFSGQSHLDSFLGHASEDIFKNVYAFTLDELQDFALLKDEEIKNKIYGAGLGLGNVSLAEVNKYFNNYCEDLFKPKGKNPSMNVLSADIRTIEWKIMEVQSHSGKYDELTASMTRLNAEQADLESKFTIGESLGKALQTQLDMFPAYVDLADAEKELAGLEKVASFPGAGMDNFKLAKSEINICKSGIEEESVDTDSLQSQLASLKVNEDLLRMEADVAALVRMTDSVSKVLKDRVVVSQERQALDASIQSEISRIGAGWGEDEIMEFAMTEAEASQAVSFSAKMDTARQDEKNAETKLDLHREHKAAENSKGWNLPAWLKKLAVVLIGVGLLGSVWGGVQANIPLLVFSIAVIAFGALFFRLVLKDKKGFSRKDDLESTLVERVKQTANRETRILEEWRLWLAGRNLDRSLTQPALEKLVALISKVKNMLAERGKLDIRSADMTETENIAKTLARKVAVCLPNISSGDNITAAIKLLAQHLKDAKQASYKRETLASKTQEQNTRVTRLKDRLKELEIGLEKLLRSVGADSEEAFLRKHEIYTRQNRLQNSIDEKRKLIQRRVGVDAAYKKFIAELASTTPLKLENEKSQNDSQLESLKEKRKILDQSIGENRVKREQLMSNDELLTLQSELEMKKEELNSLSREWAVSRVALHLLDKGKQEYEKNQQPDVIKSASGFFSRLTGYRQIIKPPDSDDILICDESENRKGVAQMSRGTREQLYLAMRFGLIQEYETRSEPLPVVMDDVFVNFDDGRRDHAIEILKEFAVGRQVIILSCHKQSLYQFIRHGARQILT